ncbi:hypothetical protein BXZ70DRAFT_400790 [Cristinia sonorae]|uniref:Uncharacterized protein n=1 Tax=Cristinia sonorae TaxID=1940300 RepID=A0A8K0UVI0_9AGAR|nr:hypothetical protein BXZ70DRAFT_400790 [Cristinia sonorae]
MSNNNIQRSTKRMNMAWRKPVPQFVPSRPTSMISMASGFSPFAAVGTKTKRYPPLPPDWREHIEQVGPAEVHDRDAVQIAELVENGTVGVVEAVVVTSGGDEALTGHELQVQLPQPTKTRSTRSAGASVTSRDSNSTRSGRKHRHQTYHPPTPPTASHASKLPRTEMFGSRSRASLTNLNVIYPDLPTYGRTPNIYPVSFDPTATMTATMTMMGSRDDFHSMSQSNRTPKSGCLVLGNRRGCRPSLWRRAKHLGGSVRLLFIRLFGFTRPPGAVTY